MATEAGRRAAIAFRAVKQCHGDLGKLLRDLDSRMAPEGWTRLWEGRDAVTYDVSKSINAEHWMPECVLRLYKNSEQQRTIEGVNVRFFGNEAVKEPLLVVGRARYSMPEGKTLADMAQGWQFLDGWLDWCHATPDDLGHVLTCEAVGGGRIEKMAVVGVDLFSIRTLADVENLLGQVREAWIARDEHGHDQ